jgi:hypothetical protein
MTYYPDMSRETVCTGPNDDVRAFGWIEPCYPYTKGPVTTEFLARLKEFASRSVQSTADAGLILFAGSYTCKFKGCGKEGRLNFGVPAGDLLFVAPEMVVHYIEQHGYAPPREFINAVMVAPLPGTPEYWTAVERFRKHHGWLDESNPCSRSPQSSTAKQSTGVTTDSPIPPQ